MKIVVIPPKQKLDYLAEDNKFDEPTKRVLNRENLDKIIVLAFFSPM